MIITSIMLCLLDHTHIGSCLSSSGRRPFHQIGSLELPSSRGNLALRTCTRTGIEAGDCY